MAPLVGGNLVIDLRDPGQARIGPAQHLVINPSQAEPPQPQLEFALPKRVRPERRSHLGRSRASPEFDGSRFRHSARSSRVPGDRATIRVVEYALRFALPQIEKWLRDVSI